MPVEHRPSALPDEDAPPYVPVFAPDRRHAAEGRALLHGGRNGKRRRHKWKIGPTMGQDFRFLVGGLVIAGVTLTLLHFLTPII